MNDMLSYFGSIDARMSAPDKEQPVMKPPVNQHPPLSTAEQQGYYSPQPQRSGANLYWTARVG
jgi:hypothetical protein